jgi:DNA-directed RNA polymerase subunit RPC12/RpoP
MIKLKSHGKNLMSTFCGHIICNTCVDEHFKASQLKSKTITCPTCRTKITRNKIHVLYL